MFPARGPREFRRAAAAACHCCAHCCAPVAPGHSNAAERLLQRCCTCTRNAPAALLDAATAASWPLQRSCNAPQTLQLLRPSHHKAIATLPDVATAAHRAPVLRWRRV